MLSRLILPPNIDPEIAPIIINMSGGRSSCGMALDMAEQGLLSNRRGDVVVFCNTAAEHPLTYDFTAQVSAELEQQHNIPVFWLEFSTVEIERSENKFARVSSYHLVNKQPWHPDSNPYGYKSGGEVFEELISWKAMLPSFHQRFCTQHMKVETSVSFLDEWLAGTAWCSAKGHTGEQQIQPADRAASYKGTSIADKAEEVFSYSYTQRHNYPTMRWSDYTTADISYREGGPASADIWNYEKPVPYVKLLGLRADEPHRVDNVIDRLLFDKDCRGGKHPAGEYLACPLFDAGTSKRDIIEWWTRRPYDLQAPSWAGNCTFCFMKGSKVVQIGAAAERQQQTLTIGHADLNWWNRMEDTYAGVSKATGATFGFLGHKGSSYKQILAEGGMIDTLDLEEAGGQLPCDCTD